MYERQVARGIAWLRAQGKEPTTFDLERLDLACGIDCPLGQAFGTLANAPLTPEVRRNVRADVDHGFDIRVSDLYRGGSRADAAYAALTAEWRTAILAERTAKRG